MVLISESVKETHEIAKDLLKIFQKGDIVFLEGDLGAGKTEMVRGFVKALGGSSADVQSPTYLSALNYSTKKGSIIHIDFYKYEKNKNFFQSFISEFLEEDPYLIFIEWGGPIAKGFLKVKIDEKDEKRYIKIFKNEKK
tara:strand:+ start:1735 stop:2151 length:417 start_codon:yes stop_codon:yes gene_type:complete